MKTFSVSQLNRIIKDLIDNEVVLEDIVVTGELSSFSVTRNIAYFTLKDNENLLSCIQFACKQEFKIGDMIQCRGNVKYYPKGGKISFNALTIELCGQGELYQQFLELKDKLGKEGLFDDVNKVPLPRFINSVGVVTSATGAVLQDIKNVVSRRNPNLDIYVYDAQVQGKYAVSDVIQGITYFDNLTDVDVIVVARGGGSIEDLMPFNDEELARIAFICNKPLISAVGHETDYTILDFVADLRAPTPSAAAELVTYDKVEMKRYVNDLYENISQLTLTKHSEIQTSVAQTINIIEHNVSDLINDEILKINSIVSRLDLRMEQNLNNATNSVNILLNTLNALNPLRLLTSGYSYISLNDEPISNLDVNIGDEIKIRTIKENLTAKITNKERL